MALEDSQAVGRRPWQHQALRESVLPAPVQRVSNTPAIADPTPPVNIPEPASDDVQGVDADLEGADLAIRVAAVDKGASRVTPPSQGLESGHCKR